MYHISFGCSLTQGLEYHIALNIFAICCGENIFLIGLIDIRGKEKKKNEPLTSSYRPCIQMKINTTTKRSRLKRPSHLNTISYFELQAYYILVQYQLHNIDRYYESAETVLYALEGYCKPNKLSSPSSLQAK
jgi:hypothetical protein